MTSAFAMDDPVESVDYDRVKSRLAVSSHYGKIKMFDVDKNGKLAPYMHVNSLNAFCRGAHFDMGKEYDGSSCRHPLRNSEIHSLHRKGRTTPCFRTGKRYYVRMNHCQSLYKCSLQ